MLPLALLFARRAAEIPPEESMRIPMPPQADPYRSLFQENLDFQDANPRIEMGGFRPPMQQGPAPPAKGPIGAMYGGSGSGPISKMHGAWERAPDEGAVLAERGLGGGGDGLRQWSPFDTVMQSGGPIAARPDYADYQRSKKTYEYRVGGDGKVYRRRASDDEVAADQRKMADVLSGGLR